MGKQITLNMSDAAAVINLCRTTGLHRDYVRIADDLQAQIMSPSSAEVEQLFAERERVSNETRK